MPWSAPKHCAHGHPPYQGRTCPACASHTRAKADQARPSASARGYDGKWRIAKKDFLAKHIACASCGKPATVVDHITPHKGDKELFWRRSNWQPLCSACHNHKTASQDGGFGRDMRPGQSNNPESVDLGPLGKQQTQYRKNWEF